MGCSAAGRVLAPLIDGHLTFSRADKWTLILHSGGSARSRRVVFLSVIALERRGHREAAAAAVVQLAAAVS